MTRISKRKPKLERSLSSLSSQIHLFREKSTSPSKNGSQSKNEISSSKPVCLNHETSVSVEDKLPNVEDQWFLKFSPKSLEEIALHSRKLGEVQRGLENIISSVDRCRILVLTGPSGCSKSTCVKLLAQKLVPKYRINSVNSLRSSSDPQPCIVEFRNDTLGRELSNVAAFDEFLAQGRLKKGSSLAVLLAEDLPNVFHITTRIAFQGSLLRWLCTEESGLPPLVISLTECELHSDEGSNASYGIETQYIAETVLGKEVLSHPKLHRIKFNPINKTLMSKHLKSIALSQKDDFAPQRWNNLTPFIKNLVLHCGDVRSGISALQFWATSNADLSGSGGFGGREETISFFHVIGRLLHGSKDYDSPNEMLNDLIAAKAHFSDNDLRLGLLENYTSYNKQSFPTTIAASLVDSLSTSDIIKFDNNTIQEGSEYAFRNARNLLDALQTENSKSPTSHARLSFPRETKVRRLRSNFKKEVDAFFCLEYEKYGQVRRYKDVTLLFGYYAPLIRRKRNYRKKVLRHYLENLQKDSVEARAAINSFRDSLCIDEEIDILSRLGGEIGMIGEELEFLGLEDTINYKNASSSKKYEGFTRREFKTQNNDDDVAVIESDFDEDPILDSEGPESDISGVNELPEDNQTGERSQVRESTHHGIDDGSDDGSDNDSEDDDTLYEILASQSPRKLLSPSNPHREMERGENDTKEDDSVESI